MSFLSFIQFCVKIDGVLLRSPYVNFAATTYNCFFTCLDTVHDSMLIIFEPMGIYLFLEKKGNHFKVHTPFIFVVPQPYHLIFLAFSNPLQVTLSVDRLMKTHNRDIVKLKFETIATWVMEAKIFAMFTYYI